MTFRLDLNLEAMLKLGGWDGQNHHDYGERYFNIWDSKYELPYTFSHVVKLVDNDGVVSTAVDFSRYHQAFLMKHFKGKNIFYVADTHLVQFYSESLSNLYTHGGDKVKEEETIIRLYHPSDPSKFILKISNPSAEEWDPRRIVRKGRGGQATFLRKCALVSYDNKGKDFLALITPPL
jgi:hypothetical protein